MKINVKEVNSNPFKKNINGGKLDQDTVKKIQANMKELGLMGALPVFKKDGKTHLISGHHRLAALKKEFGNDVQVEVVYHNYSEENVLRGMVVENLTQRGNDFREEAENLTLIRKFLKKSSLAVHQVNNHNSRPQNNPEPGSISQICEWLNSQGEVMSRGKICETLNIIDKVDSDIIDRIKKVSGNKAPEEVVTKKQAIELSKIEDKQEQREILEAMKREDKGRPHELVSKYKEASDEVKEKVRSGELNLGDVPMENLKEEIKQRAMEESERKEQEDIKELKVI